MKTFCPECGFGVAVDEDGCCLYCGSVATGIAVDELANTANVCKCDGMRSDGWISVGTRMPRDKQYVLVDPPFISGAFKDEPRHVLFWNKRLGRFQYYLGGSVHNAYDIRHWRTLPNYAYSTIEEYESIVGRICIYEQHSTDNFGGSK